MKGKLLLIRRYFQEARYSKKVTSTENTYSSRLISVRFSIFLLHKRRKRKERRESRRK
jgi:hypothetical protein